MKNNTLIIVIIIVLILGVAAYLIMKPQPISPTPSVPYTPPTSIQPTAPTTALPASLNSSINIINIQSFAFNPSTLTVKAGTKVTWTNNDSVAHTVTSDSGKFDSGNISPGQSFSYTFTNTGTFNYHCTIHPMMKGTVVVG